MLDKNTVRRRALELIARDGQGVAARLAAEFGVSRQTANTHLKALLEANQIEAEGATKAKTYSLAITHQALRSFPCQDLQEEVVWREWMARQVDDLPQSVRDIWHYGLSEMVNNAIDHSGSDQMYVEIRRDPLFTEMRVGDEGEGIFLKIQRILGLYDAREAMLELAKGKLTTDPEHHSGQGIFFTSRMMDEFIIMSGKLGFVHRQQERDWLIEIAADTPGTRVIMRLANDSPRTAKEVFDQYSDPEEYSFAKTIVPVRLAQYEGERLVSRSQAKRLYTRFERFRQVILDFKGVEEIGQAFADELFRVFPNAHPSVELVPMNSTKAVEQMISRARAHSSS